jgi:hypothetical protein
MTECGLVFLCNVTGINRSLCGYDQCSFFKIPKSHTDVRKGEFWTMNSSVLQTLWMVTNWFRLGFSPVQLVYKLWYTHRPSQMLQSSPQIGNRSVNNVDDKTFSQDWILLVGCGSEECYEETTGWFQCNVTIDMPITRILSFFFR